MRGALARRYVILGSRNREPVPRGEGEGPAEPGASVSAGPCHATEPRPPHPRPDRAGPVSLPIRFGLSPSPRGHYTKRQEIWLSPEESPMTVKLLVASLVLLAGLAAWRFAAPAHAEAADKDDGPALVHNV